MGKWFPFKGFDWAELATYFELTKHKKDPDDASELIEFLFLIADNFDKTQRGHTDVVAICTTFTKKMVEMDLFPGTPVFKALLKLEDEVFLKHFALLVPVMCN